MGVWGVREREREGLGFRVWGFKVWGLGLRVGV